MNYTKISELPVATTSDTTDVLPIVQSGETRQIDVNAFRHQRNAVICADLFDSEAISGVMGPLAIGDNDVYTIPTGRRAAITVAILVNDSGGNVTTFLELKHSGTYYRISGSGTAATGALAAMTVPGTLILDAGDILAINAATTAGAYVVLDVIEFSSTSAYCGAYVFGTSNGDNVLYTCPAGKTAVAKSMGATFTTRAPITIATGAVAPGLCSLKLVKSGGSPSLTVVQSINQLGTNGLNSNVTAIGSLTAGDSLVLNVATGDTAQLVNCAFIEM